MKLKIIITIIAVIVLSNLIPDFNIGAAYYYQTAGGEYSRTVVPSKGRRFDLMIADFEQFKLDNPQHNELKLYRTTHRNWLKFWRWWHYLTMDVYSIPYRKFE